MAFLALAGGFADSTLQLPFRVQSPGLSPRLSSKIDLGQSFVCLENRSVHLSGVSLDVYVGAVGIRRARRKIFLSEGAVSISEVSTQEQAGQENLVISFSRGEVTLTGGEFLSIQGDGQIRWRKKKNSKMGTMWLDGRAFKIKGGQLLVVQGEKVTIYESKPKEPGDEQLAHFSDSDILKSYRMSSDSDADSSSRVKSEAIFIKNHDFARERERAQSSTRRYTPF